MEQLLLNIQALFRTVLRMSLSAAILVPAALALRLLLRKAPKWLRCLLWLPVALRLLCPVLPEAGVSLMPRAERYAASEQRLAAAADGALPVLEFETPRDRELNRYGAAQGIRAVSVAFPSVYLPVLWALGVLGMLLYGLLSFLRLRRRTAPSIPMEEGVFLCDGIDSPFILGIVRPRICLPARLGAEQRSHVLAHERAHLRRRDHWWKPLGFLLLSLHWFNPLLWLAYVLLCRDIELACDERAVRDLDRQGRADYAQALLDCSFPRRSAGMCPLAFGEVGVRQRVKDVLNYRKPAFWIVLVSAAVCAAAALCFLTEPVSILPGEGGIVSAEYASVGDNISLDPDTWTELCALIEDHRGRRFPAGTDALGVLSRSVSLHYADGSLLLVHHQYIGGFDLLRGREDDYRTIVTLFDAAGKARKAWRMEESFDEAFADWRSRRIPRTENALDWLWKRYEVKDVLCDLGGDEAWTDVRRCAISEDYALLVSVGESGEWRTVGRLEPFTPEKDGFDGKHGDYAGYASAAGLRKQNRMAWRAVAPKDTEDGEARFYDLLFQKNGDSLLAVGRYDAGEAGDPDSDDSRVYRILRLTGILEEEPGGAPDLEALREKYPEYFGLSAFKGLELYVWQMGQGVLRCGLMEGTNRNKTNEEIWSLHGATAEEMKAILSTYDVPQEDIILIPFLHPVSSYIYEIDEEYRQWLRELFFGSAAIAAAPQPEEPGKAAEAPLLTVSCGGASVVPYLHFRWAETWLEEEQCFLAADGVPVEWDIDEHQDEIPILVLNGELTLALGEGVRRAGPMLQVYDAELNWLFCQVDEGFEALYGLEPGDYWCTVGICREGTYIPAADRHEGNGYDGVFRLWVPEDGREGE